MSNHQKPIIYVVISSAHTIPSLLAVLSQQSTPEKVLIVASAKKDIQDAANRLASMLRQLKPNIDTQLLPSDHLSGESMAEMRTWIDDHFIKIHREYKGYNWILNITGGTKIMPMALEKAISWHEVHYKSFNSPNLQRWDSEFLLTEIPIAPISPIDVLRTYIEVRKVQPNKIDELPDAITIAQKIWDYYAQPREKNPHILLSEKLNEYWVTKEKQKSKTVSISWFSFQLPPDDLQALKSWCQTLADFSNQGFTLTNDELIIPSNEARGLKKHWKKWISGAWLETLVNHWLVEDVNLSSEDVAMNIYLDKYERELDFVFLQENKLIAIEAKSAPKADENALNLIIQQIKSVTDVGILTNYLFISPYFEKIVANEQRMTAFLEHCDVNNIKVLRSKEDLINQFKR